MPGGSFDIIIAASPSAAGVFSNPRIPGVATVDPDHLIAENYANNSASDTVTVTQNRYLTITQAAMQHRRRVHADNVTVFGTGINDGDTVTIQIHDTDGPPYDYSSLVTQTVKDGMWSVSGIDASSLVDGWIIYNVKEQNASGTVIGIVPSTAWWGFKGNALQFGDAPDITDANVTDVSVFGLAAFPDDSIEFEVTDGTVIEGGISAGAHTVVGHATWSLGTWSVSGIDASSLLDGTVTYIVFEYDNSYNDNGPAFVTATATKSTGVLAFTSAPDITDDNKSSVSASGTGGYGDSIEVTITDSLGDITDVATGTVGSDGQWSVSNINAAVLLDGDVTYSVTPTDSAGTETTITRAATKHTTAIALAFTRTPDINAASVASVAVTGTGVAGSEIFVNITDGTEDGFHATGDATTTVGGDGTWSVSGIDASRLEDGQVTYVATEIDPLGDIDTIFQSANKSINSAAPTVAMTAPADNAIMNDDTPTLSATATDKSGSGLAVLPCCSIAATGAPPGNPPEQP